MNYAHPECLHVEVASLDLFCMKRFYRNHLLPTHLLSWLSLASTPLFDVGEFQGKVRVIYLNISEMFCYMYFIICSVFWPITCCCSCRGLAVRVQLVRRLLLFLFVSTWEVVRYLMHQCHYSIYHHFMTIHVRQQNIFVPICPFKSGKNSQDSYVKLVGKKTILAKLGLKCMQKATDSFETEICAEFRYSLFKILRAEKSEIDSTDDERSLNRAKLVPLTYLAYWMYEQNKMSSL